MSTSFTPFDPDYYDIIEKEKAAKPGCIVHYFGENNTIEDIKSSIKDVITVDFHQDHLLFANGEKVRIDRIITLNGKPGPAYDEYDRYSLACMDCKAGRD